MKYSVSKENYLKAIYHLQGGNTLVTTNALASALQAKPASITDMLKKLKAEKLLIYERYQGFKLNNEGKKVALLIIRKHRLWECFLVNKLQFGWEEVHDMAEELEHLTSKKLIDRLEAFLEFPASDPHGDPIPDSQGKFNQEQLVPLNEFPLNKMARVAGVGNQTKEMLDLMQHKNLQIGTKLEVRKKFPFDNSLELKVRNLPPITISEVVAKNIMVKDEG